MTNEHFHVHFESRKTAPHVFRISPERVTEAFARRPDLADRLHVTVGQDLDIYDDAMKTARMLVGFFFPRNNLAARAPRLQAIQFAGAGLESLSPFGWVPPGVMMLNNSGVHAKKATEFITMAVLMLNVRVPGLIAAQARRQWAPVYTGSLRGKTLLVVGMGKLAAGGAAICRQMGMTVVGVRRSGTPHPDCDRTVGTAALHDELPRADIVLLTMPLTAETHHMIGAREIGLMKPGAALINFARGKVLDHAPLLAALESGHLSGAVLDVFDPEPLPAESPVWTTPNLFVSPHCASDDLDLYIPDTLDIAFENAGRLAEGRPPVNLFDPVAGY